MALKVACASRPLAGETDCGDVCAWWSQPERLVLALADGLGHGPQAAAAARAAMACIGANLDRSCEQIFALCDTQLHNTRGVALALVIIELATGQLTLGSVGNVRSLLLRSSQHRRFGGARGIVGGGYSSLMPETLILAPGDLLTLFSDGFDEHLPLEESFLLDLASEQALADTVLSRWARPTDDAGVLVYRHEVLMMTVP